MSETAASARWESVERRQRACEAALAAAARLGVHAQRAVILEDWNNTIVRLSPSPLVAKVGTSYFRDAQLESLEREVSVAAHLAKRGAPVVPPALEVPPGPHDWQGLTLTLWQYVEPIPDATLVPAQIAGALNVVHQGLADLTATLPSFTIELDYATRLLQPDRTPR